MTLISVSLANHVVILPNLPAVPALWKHLGLKNVDYENRIREALRVTWGDCEEDDFRDDVVGDVDGIEILRDTIEFTRETDE